MMIYLKNLLVFSVVCCLAVAVLGCTDDPATANSAAGAQPQMAQTESVPPQAPPLTQVAAVVPPPRPGAQNTSAAPKETQDTPDTVFKPPKGSQMAIVVFEDLQCPMCRATAPLVEQASKTYKIPVIRHDFPLPMHNWSYQAAVMARYFDTYSKSLGNDFRDYCFENQLEINPQNLRSYGEKFAAAHKVDLPFVIDQGGKLSALVNADRDLGKAIKLDHTPTVYVVSSKNPSKPYLEVKDRSQLYSTIDAMMKN